MQKHPNIIQTDDLEWKAGGNGEKFVFKRKWLSNHSGGEKLGCSIYRVPPGKTAYPHHRHLANEEAIYVLSGLGQLRLDEKRIEVGSGDYITLPAGAACHQLFNNGQDDLEYLCMSTMLHPDITEYPDSDKVIAFSGSGPAGDLSVRNFFGIYRASDKLEYYDGE